jgi:Ca2+-transporting ATPase
MTTFSLASIFFALETNDELRSVFSQVTLESHRLLQMCGWSLLATFLVTAPDFMQRIFGTKDLNIGQWIICIVVGSLILWVTEIVKIFRRQAADAVAAAEPEMAAATQKTA